MRTFFAMALLVVIAGACSGDKPACAASGVICPSVAAVTVDPPTVALFIGERADLHANVDARDGAPSTVTWSSSNASVATVTADGRVSGVLPGLATITARSTYDRNKAGAARVNVSLVPVATVVISSGGVSSLRIHETLQLSATARNASGQDLSDRAITWSSSNASVASVSKDGLVTGLAEGSVQITATAGGKSGILTLIMTPAAVKTVDVTPTGSR